MGLRKRGVATSPGSVAETASTQENASSLSTLPFKPSFVNQLWALTRKNTLVVLRKPILLASAVLLPFLAFIVVGAMQEALNRKQDNSAAVEQLWSQTHEVTLPPSGHTKMFFFPDDERTTEIMKRVAAMNNLKYGNDIIPSKDSSSMAINLVANGPALIDMDWWTAIRFEYNTSSVGYTFLDNFEAASYKGSVVDKDFSNPKVNTFITATQFAIDAAILSYSRDQSPSANWQNDKSKLTLDFFQGLGSADTDLFSLEVNTKTNTRVGASFGSGRKEIDLDLGDILLRPIVAVAFIPIMVMVLDLVSKEKQRKLIGALRRMGLMDSVFWISLLIPVSAVCLISAFAGAAGAKAVAGSAKIFQLTSFGVIVFANFTYALGLAGLGAAFAAIVSRPVFVNVAVGLSSSAALVLNFAFFIPDPLDVFPFRATWFNSCREVYAKVLLLLFAPFYNYGKIWNDISLIALPNVLNNQTTKNFDFPDFFAPNRVPNLAIPVESLSIPLRTALVDYTKIDTPFVTCLHLVATFLILSVAAWYLNQVVPSIEGFRRPAHFFVTRSYWTGRSERKDKIVPGDTLAMEKARSEKTSSVRIVKLSKQYGGNTAVKEFSSVFENGKVYAVLGHNGAGKTTLINMLSMVTSPSFGDCFMFGMDVREDIQALQSQMSLCPQFDALYPSLTAYQHILFYIQFRGEIKGSKEEISKFIMARLDSVGLAEAADRRVGGFSGGMKRRLSLALAAVSESARIVFLDEPTTGLDPLSRRKVWKVIQEIKQNRVVVLTTHSMEEADELGDHICIMHQGRLRASGSSLFLKNRFGKGYQLTIVNRQQQKSPSSTLGVTQPTNVDERLSGQDSGDHAVLVRSAMEQYVGYALPGSEIVSSAAGAITVAVSRQASRRLAAFLKMLRGDKGVDWSISNSTLEEVFLKLCTENKAVVTESEGDAVESGQKKPEARLCVLCASRPSEVVTLYTKNGIKVTIPYFVCSPCAEGETESKRDVGDAKADGIAAVAADGSPLLSFEQFVTNLPEQYQNAIKAAATKEDKAKMDQSGHVDDGRATGTASLLARQVEAVVLKNLRLHGKERRTNWCFVVVVLLLNIVAALYGKISGPASDIFDECPRFAFKLRGSSSCSPSVIALALNTGLTDTNLDLGLRSTSTRADFFYNFRFMLATSPSTINQVFSLGGNQNATQALAGTFRRRVAFSQEAGVGLETILDPAALNAGLAEQKRQFSLYQQAKVNETDLPPLFTKVSSSGARNPVVGYGLDQQNLLAAKKGKLSGGCATDFGGRSPAVQVDRLSDYPDIVGKAYPDVGLAVRDLRISKDSVGADYGVVAYPPLYGARPLVAAFSSDPALLTDVKGQAFGKTPSQCVAIFPAGPVGYAYQTNGLVNYVTNGILSKIPEAPFKEIKTGVAKGAKVETNSKDTIVEKLLRGTYLIFLLLATGIMYPRMVTLLVQEKRENLVEMMRTQGLGLFQYWIGNYIYAFGAIFSLNLIFLIIAVAASSPFLAKAGYPAVVGVLILWSHAQVCLGWFLSGLITKTVSAGMVSYLVHVGSAVAAPFFVAIADVNGAIPIAYCLFPPLGVASVFNILMLSKNASAALVPALVVLFGSVLLGLLGCYIHAIRPSPVGIPVHPLLGLERFFASKKQAVTEKDIRDVESMADVVDQDVVEEKNRVAQAHQTGAVDSREAVRLVNLRKSFPGKLAVDDISLSIPYGETFGMLGPNGAGKTTTISILTGLLQRTSGSVTIAGVNIDDARSNRGGVDSLWRLIGITPQFDTVWNEMTVEEHLRFYCRLRGVGKAMLTATVRRIAEDIELDGDAFKSLAKDLSGGMRRRLSIGIALTANPKILVLDEPTTGLDAEAKRQVWKIIDGIRRSGGDRCVIITTHSMEEADALCTRIGIVCDGNLKVLGSQLHLKKKHGNGLKLTARFAVSASYVSSNDSDLIVPLSFLEDAQARRVNRVSDALLSTLQSHALANHPTNVRPSMRVTTSDIAVTHANAAAGSFGGRVGEALDMAWMVTLTCVLPRSMVDVADVFLDLEETCLRMDVGDWALTETTLEDVFVRVVE
ncbi:hypothetical protein HDU97_007031, partial [Phlyctochytrium planicorne]